MRILVVEDESRLARHVASALVEAGHDPKVLQDGETAIGEAQENSYDLVLLDVMLPGIDGFETLRRLRSAGVRSRVLMLTARGEVNDRVTGLQLGADDYLPKPFAMQELLARTRALGRRYSERATLKLRVGDLSVGVEDQMVVRGRQAIELSSRELTLLKVLMREPGRVFTRAELCERVWQRKHDYDTKLVELFIGRLRKKLGAPAVIQTVRHVGYKINDQ